MTLSGHLAAISFDHLVGAGEQRWRNLEAERARPSFKESGMSQMTLPEELPL